MPATVFTGNRQEGTAGQALAAVWRAWVLECLFQ
jgi:hypothetical protein